MGKHGSSAGYYLLPVGSSLRSAIRTLTQDTDSAARDPERHLDDELEIRVGHSHSLPCHHAARTLMPRLRREALCYIPGVAGRNSKGGSWV